MSNSSEIVGTSLESETQAQLCPPPIQRLPPDILANIFILCLPKKDQRVSSSQAPLLLCRVCTSWRALATSTPHLWTALYFHIKTGSKTVDIESGVRAWLSYSGSLSFDIRFDCLPSERHTPMVRLVCEAMSEHASRWGSIESYTGVPPGVWSKLNSLPLLRSITVAAPIDVPPFTSAPRLTVLTLLEYSDTPRSAWNIPWHQLTDLTIKRGTTCRTALEFIRCCPQLESLWLTAIQGSEDDQPYPQAESTTLQTLHFEFFSDCRPVLNSLVLPALTKLEVGYDPNLLLFMPGVPFYFQELIDFLSRSHCKLQRLKLIYSGFGFNKFLECFSHQSCRTLTSLSTADVAGIVNDKFLLGFMYDEMAAMPLLPKLANLTLSNCCSMGGSCGLVGRMVLSRYYQGGHFKSFELSTFHPLSKEDVDLLEKARADGMELVYEILSSRLTLM